MPHNVWSADVSDLLTALSERDAEIAALKKPAFIVNANVLYFGCIGGSGHYLHDKLNPQRRYDSTPWGNSLDGALDPQDQQGVAMLSRREGWTAIGWSDRTVDSRPGSHSVFLVEAEVTAEQLLQAAKEQWPQVFSRFRFPIKLP
jgi:hypothetical protein